MTTLGDTTAQTTRLRGASWLVDPKWFVLGPVVAIVVWLALVPLGFLVWQSFMTPDTVAAPAHFTLDNFREAYSGEDTLDLFATSLAFATGTAMLALAIGSALAWIAERTNTPFKSMIYALSVVPLVIPGILFVVSWIMLGSPKIGLLNLVFQHIFNTDAILIDVYTLPGMIWVDGIHYAPIAFLLMTAAFRAMDPSLEESAMMSGASTGQIARHVTFKLAWPAMAASFLILFVRALESFETPALLGLPVGIQVFTSSIYDAIHRYPSDIGLASAYALTLLAITAGGVWWQSRISAEAGKYSTVTGKGFRPRVMDIGRWRWATAGFFVTYALCVVGLPFLVLLKIPMAFAGVILGLLISGEPVSLYTMYGGVALAGIAVNSAILMFAAAHDRLERGMSVVHASVWAAKRRLLPIIITSLTTLVGLLPLALSDDTSATMWKPVATAIVWGVGFSTLFTLFIMPLLYRLAMGWVLRVKAA